MSPYTFGVNFIVPVEFYQLVSRAAKYAMMFLATAFMAVFVLELRSACSVHPVQYLFVGLTMVFFYILLLSLAEQIGFLWAYLIAAGATGGLLSLYVGRVQRSVPRACSCWPCSLSSMGALSHPAARGLRTAGGCDRRVRDARDGDVCDPQGRVVGRDARPA